MQIGLDKKPMKVTANKCRAALQNEPSLLENSGDTTMEMTANKGQGHGFYTEREPKDLCGRSAAAGRGHGAREGGREDHE